MALLEVSPFKKEITESPAGLVVNNSALSLLWLRFNPGPEGREEGGKEEIGIRLQGMKLLADSLQL